MARCCSAAGQRGASGSGQQVRRQSSQPTTSSGGAARQAAALSSYRVLVLDRAYHPVGLVNWQQAICLDLLERVEVLEYYDRLLRSAYCRHPLPAVVKSEHLIAAKKLSGARVNPTRKNVLRRDNFRCQYCGSRSSLTLDHIVPLSKGGTSSWDNLTTACHRCNNAKGDKLLSQTQMKLQTAPKAPSFTSSSLLLSVLSAGGSHLPKEWQAYLDPFQKRLPEALDDQSCPSTTPLRHA